MDTALANSHEIGSEQAKANWKKVAAGAAAILLAVMFLVSGGWKVLSPFKTGELLEQAQVSAGWGSLGAAALGTLELLAAFLLLVPRFRRAGAILGGGLLIFFIGWIGYYYNSLVGHECSCFPIIKRTVGPGFFIGDGIMLVLAVTAWFWSPRVKSWRWPTAAFASLALLAGASYGVNLSRRAHVQVPTPVVVDGKAVDLAEGKVFLFFYDPSCMHCDAAAKFMSTLNWGGNRVVSIPTVNPQWAASFLHDTHLKAGTSLEVDKLKKAFPFVDPPYGVALDHGEVEKTFGQAQFNVPLPRPDLQRLGFVK